MSFAELPDWVRDVYIDKDVLAGPPVPVVQDRAIVAQLRRDDGRQRVLLHRGHRRAVPVRGTAAGRRLLGQDVTRIVLGRPVRFSTDPQMDALAQGRLLRAAFRAGYDEIFLQPEPIAAAYFYETTIRHPENVLIFDFGGGTLDITIARLGEPGRRAILATGGIPIAGDVFDRKLVRASSGTSARNDVPRRRTDAPGAGHYFEAFSHWQNMLAQHAA